MTRGEQEVNPKTKRMLLVLGVVAVMAALVAGTALAADSTSFNMVRSQSARAIDDCMEGARANVTIDTVRVNQVMTIKASNMPPNTLFTLFVIQRPNSPFGVVWYQGDLRTNDEGTGQVTVKGIFSEETFAFGAGSAPAPQIDDQDAANNPAFKPVHTLHLGLWFASSRGAARAGCGSTVTPFDGDHEAGIQALSTRNFGALQGPLGQID
jgi:type II secretory pathway pseudopilin PulG